MLLFNKKQLRLHLMQQRKSNEYKAFQENSANLLQLHQNIARDMIDQLMDRLATQLLAQFKDPDTKKFSRSF